MKKITMYSGDPCPYCNAAKALLKTKSVEIEESLSLEEREKELIQKALKKHNGRRKNAAKELGISERTLYRKIKEFEILK